MEPRPERYLDDFVDGICDAYWSRLSLKSLLQTEPQGHPSAGIGLRVRIPPYNPAMTNAVYVSGCGENLATTVEQRLLNDRNGFFAPPKDGRQKLFEIISGDDAGAWEDVLGEAMEAIDAWHRPVIIAAAPSQRSFFLRAAPPHAPPLIQTVAGAWNSEFHLMSVAHLPSDSTYLLACDPTRVRVNSDESWTRPDAVPAGREDGHDVMRFEVRAEPLIKAANAIARITHPAIQARAR